MIFVKTEKKKKTLTKQNMKQKKQLSKQYVKM